MNARGSTEVIVASIGLSIGALSQNLYTMIVTMALLTTSAMPPTLRWALSRVPLRTDEKERLDREAFESRGFVANMERLLLTVSDKANGRFASRLAGLLAGRRGLPTTLLHVQGEPGTTESNSNATVDASDLVENVKQGGGEASSMPPGSPEKATTVEVRARVENTDAEEAILREAPKGYDLLFIGLDPAKMSGGEFNSEVVRAVRAYDGPVAVAVSRGVHETDPVRGPIRILAPITGTAISKHAAELSIELARAAQVEITVLYVAQPSRSDHGLRRGLMMVARRDEEAALRQIVEIGDHYNVDVRTKFLISLRRPPFNSGGGCANRRDIDCSRRCNSTGRHHPLRQYCRSYASR